MSKAATRTDAERVLADDPEGLALLHAVLHGPEGAAVRPLPTLAERFAVPRASDRAKRRRAPCNAG